MLKIDRQNAIMKMLNEQGSILVADACEKLNCSDQTIRRDLSELEKEGKLIKAFGGAYLPSDEDKGIPIQLRSKMIPEEKQHIGYTAAQQFIQPNDYISIDSSTTCLTLAHYVLDHKMQVTILTNSLNIITLFSEPQPNTKLICVGGKYNSRSGSFVGENAINTYSQYLTNSTFISCNALDKQFGMLDNYEKQKYIRQEMLKHARHKYLLVDHTKFDDEGAFLISSISVLDAIITDQQPNKTWMDYFQENEIKVIW
ncbi:MAG: DeoR/GlpR family DNA-binding transcription regulator [Erysipelotrichaceae bacterium]|jgi:DeoR/GlpR family transcriptional regulator of sugar metabolism|uniref:DeoR/GlpR family DNA-binding transcription regulator n=1 Tax=Lactimicrobium massiliense TaxID=2161814 RepID=UPI000D55DBDA|nr:DeoR/GlpR family DNA-binding transcription regulator [Lactimicrobium massiliense]MCH4020562.1 DeoR/GlpR family DNA-binding transcription regulator [Erysipelotrichaceae bacterium]MCH4044443.1 DeoR/GlpR family DNA-binding transcription regulator [Erysipelotrichaceae bacterium]MCH4121656.1 DeoR/GlpR family DNA-binding transcription regulator [Erysipelotrichaceae bacterium]